MPAANIIDRFPNDQSADAAIGYGLMAAGIALANIAAANGLGRRPDTKATAINNSLK